MMQVSGSVKVHKDHQLVKDHGRGSWWYKRVEHGEDVFVVVDLDGTETEYRNGDFDALGHGAVCGGPVSQHCGTCYGGRRDES